MPVTGILAKVTAKLYIVQVPSCEYLLDSFL